MLHPDNSVNRKTEVIILVNVCHDTADHWGRCSQSAWKGFRKASSMLLYLLRVKLVYKCTSWASILLLCCKDQTEGESWPFGSISWSFSQTQPLTTAEHRFLSSDAAGFASQQMHYIHVKIILVHSDSRASFYWWFLCRNLIYFIKIHVEGAPPVIHTWIKFSFHPLYCSFGDSVCFQGAPTKTCPSTKRTWPWHFRTQILTNMLTP